MGNKKYTLQDVVLLDSALNEVEKVTGFNVDTLLKLAKLKAEVERFAESFMKEKDRVWKGLKIDQDTLPEGYRESLDYTQVGLSSGIRIVIKTNDFIEASDKFEEGLDKEVELQFDQKFKLSDFEIERQVDKEKKKVSLVNSNVIKHLMNFIE